MDLIGKTSKRERERESRSTILLWMQQQQQLWEERAPAEGTVKGSSGDTRQMEDIVGPGAFIRLSLSLSLFFSLNRNESGKSRNPLLSFYVGRTPFILGTTRV